MSGLHRWPFSYVRVMGYRTNRKGGTDLSDFAEVYISPTTCGMYFVEPRCNCLASITRRPAGIADLTFSVVRGLEKKIPTQKLSWRRRQEREPDSSFTCIR